MSEIYPPMPEIPDQADLARERLPQIQKMEALGQLTGGIAHDFNNLLTVIIGNLETAQRVQPLDEATTARHKSAIANALRGARRAAILSQRLLAFSRRGDGEPCLVDINSTIAEEVEFLQRVIGESIAVEAVPYPGLWQVKVDENQLQTTLLNLAVNARDAMPEGGKLVIATANAVLENSEAGIPAGHYVTLSVADTGIGMTSEVLHHAFEPFFTTKSVGHGTGLGLSQVHGFISEANGHIAIDSAPGNGTRIKIYLPRHQAIGAAIGMAPPPRTAAMPADRTPVP